MVGRKVPEATDGRSHEGQLNVQRFSDCLTPDDMATRATTSIAARCAGHLRGAYLLGPSPCQPKPACSRSIGQSRYSK